LKSLLPDLKEPADFFADEKYFDLREPGKLRDLTKTT
jgi:hypothetical protein